MKILFIPKICVNQNAQAKAFGRLKTAILTTFFIRDHQIAINSHKTVNDWL